MNRMLGKLSRRLQLMIGRCIVQAARADGGRVLVAIDGLDGEASDQVEWAEPWGMTSVPLAGAEGVALSVMGERGHRVVLSLGDRNHRPRDLVPGETCLFDDLGNRVEIRRDRIRITAVDQLEITAPLARINGQAIATVTDEVNVGAGSSAGRWPIVTGVGDDG